MPTRLCLEPRCPNPATYRGRCQAHTRANERQTRRAGHAIYRTARWQHTRRHVLHHQPLCPGVLGEPCGHIATDVHHRTDIDAGGDPWAIDNLEALCHACHSRITARTLHAG